jgi:hypothetical protein
MSITNCEGVAMLFVALISSVFFLVVGSSGPRIVSQCDVGGNLGIINWTSSFCGLFATSLNNCFSSFNLSYDFRFFLAARGSLIRSRCRLQLAADRRDREKRPIGGSATIFMELRAGFSNFSDFPGNRPKNRAASGPMRPTHNWRKPHKA